MSPRRRLLSLAGLGAGLLAITAAGLAAQAADHRSLFLVLALGQGALYLAAAWLVWRNPPPRSLIVILLVAAAARLAVLAAPPYLSDDVNRYVWDGRVQGAGINPYRYVPTDEHLADLRDDAIFPNINRSNYAHTIYPPVAQMVFFLVTRLSERVTAMKIAMLGFELVTIAALMRLLRHLDAPAERLLLYAWHPLPIWEIAGNGHLDAAALAFLMLAYCAKARGRSFAAGVALGAATLVKFLPAVILPALWRRGEWRLPVALLVTVAAAYAVYIGPAGTKVFGFLGGYSAEEQLVSGGGFFLWTVALSVWQWMGGTSPAALGALPYLILALGVLAWLALRSLSTEENLDAELGAGATLVFALLVLLSPHYPWYFLLAVPFFCFRPYPPMLWLTVASFLLYALGWPAPADAHRMLVESLMYGGCLALALYLWLRDRRDRREGVAHDAGAA